jgi:hypothetical protein
MTRTTCKNRINKILRETTKGLHKDISWMPIHAAFRALDEAGFEVSFTGSHYSKDESGTPCSKTWTFEIEFGTKPIYGIATAHGAGTVQDPLSCYDVTAYVS